MPPALPVSLDLSSLAAAYAAGTMTPTALVHLILARDQDLADPAVWISRPDPAALLARAAALEAVPVAQRGPLWGVPFAVKDNIDVLGLPTTAACPGFAYSPVRSAPAVARLLEAGAILVGKTNLDQFATGLVGVRSPYGIPNNPFGAALVPGGSSSGSAVAVARGLCSVALGTDTAGSGRVPAGFNGLVGLKPSRGIIPTTGVVPACRSLDCVSVFALTVADAWAVLTVVAGEDAEDPYGRSLRQIGFGTGSGRLRSAVPQADQMPWQGDAGYAEAWTAVRESLAAAFGAPPVAIDPTGLQAAAQLLYDGPWVAERWAGFGAFVDRQPDAVWPLTRTIAEGGRAVTGAATFKGLHTLETLRRAAQALFATIDVLVVPTAPTLPTRDQVAGDPLGLNGVLGTWTNFVNLLDLCALAIPAGMTTDGRPFGITLIAPAGYDQALAACAAALRMRSALPATPIPGLATPGPERAVPAPEPARVPVLVLGAHLRGQPLNPELVGLGGEYLETVRTAPTYRLYALAATTPAKPGLVRTLDDSAETGGAQTGGAIEGELWSLTAEGLGRLLTRIPPPLGLGTITLADGRLVKGFLCEAHAVAGAREITGFGGWRAFLATQG